ncbi:hypothetical protein GRI34_01765 [Erythrobacter aquimaris]|uniref:HPr kinase/phosphorylase C-terminal domain-containing protein n=1 Tax=Qipengyuania aquimaris TaxID=255984 RepID=A0A6I4TKU0_9SPHN|nr:hypothetical protein [Qipengyuania aquimaris]MXO95143.1 hypothetical protein [Qipengyuania aquimaris]
MSAPFHYRHSGLYVSSDLCLPEWEGFACEDGDDVRITLESGQGPDYKEADGTIVEREVIRFAIDGVGVWEIASGNTIRIYPREGVSERELRLFTLGSAWGALGYQRGLAMWHGSVVAKDDETILFCGDAGMGKSTMAAAMLAHGWALVSDDLSRVDADLQRAIVHPASTRIKLWRDAIELLGWEKHILQRDHFRDYKFHLSAPDHHGGAGALPLAAIFVLAEGNRFEIERLEGHRAVKAVLAATVYRPEMLEALDGWVGQAQIAAQIVARTPVFILRRPRDLGALGKLAQTVEEHLSE